MVHKFQQSAGGLVYKKESGKIKILLLEWLNAKRQKIFVLPKWKIEQWENIQETALREISEEAGFLLEDLEIVKFMKKVNFNFIAHYEKGSPMIEKDVYLFLVQYKGKTNPRPRKKERFTGYKWFEIEELQKVDSKPEDIYDLAKNNKCFM